MANRSHVFTHHREIRSLLIILSTVLGLKGITRATSWTQEATPIHVQEHIHVAHITCNGTLYPEQCVSLLSSLPDLASRTLPQMISFVLNHTATEVELCSCDCSDVKESENLAQAEQQALDDCIHLFEDTNSALRGIIADLDQNATGSKPYHGFQTALSAAITNVHTCLDSLTYYSEKNLTDRFQEKLSRVTYHFSNSLVMLRKVPEGKKSFKSEVFPEYGEMVGGFPAWVSELDRRSLEANVDKMKFDCVVAKDGSGKFKSIKEAINKAPESSSKRFTIYIKAGVYKEQVEVTKKKINLMLIGDGMGRTIITGSKNVVDGSTTFRSATFAVAGKGFIARGITFENTAGPEKHQAVALRNGADFTAFYKCSFLGYQDTLYAYSNRQFYRDCDIYGTVDFIFGNAAVVFQECNIFARKGSQKQNTLVLTAQGRKDPNQNTGISIIDCTIAPAKDLIPVKSKFKVYLGRPWKQYSRTVYIRSFLGDLIHPAGWLEWSGNFALDTLYYGEYQNKGPGSNTKNRVKWKGYRVITNAKEASKFTVDQFIQGNEWLKATGIPYFPGLG